MNSKIYLSIIATAWLACTAATTAAPGYYEVTGQVLEVSDTTIVVDKGGEKWHLMRDSSTNVKGELKVGAKVTVAYKMTATSVDVKEKAGSTATQKK